MKKFFSLLFFVTLWTGLSAQTTDEQIREAADGFGVAVDDLRQFVLTHQKTDTPYRIGDTGPAGGIVFYDKRNDTDGWRYLEAAPADTEFAATWDPPGRSFSQRASDDAAIGKGADNTKAIVALFLENGGGFASAAWDCDDLVVNDFDDWFLPSLTELNYMFGNLHRRGLGGFSGNRYWSSTRFEQYGSYYAFSINFQDGTQEAKSKNERYSVRAIRRF